MNDFRIREEKMPLLFVGHGNPMYAIEKNKYTRAWNEIGDAIPKPEAILCISAHWETEGTFITSMEKPRTIHDFYGFQKELFDVVYPAPGSPLLAQLTKGLIKTTSARLDSAWGLDRGCWAVIKHVYPNANIPVIQLSLTINKSPQWHYELGKELNVLRSMGVLIIGSGNIVHNLRMADWRNKESAYDWALETNDILKKLILKENHTELINYNTLGNGTSLAIPTPEHYLPLLYILGMKEKDEPVSFFNDIVEMGSMSMTSFVVGKY